MRTSILLKLMLAAALPMLATDDAPAADAVAQAAPEEDAAATDVKAGDATAGVGAPASAQAQSSAVTQEPAPITQTPTPVAQPGNPDDPVLETVKTPAHSVAEEIHDAVKAIEAVPAEVLAWFETKFGELKAHIKALL